ncbi:MAG: fibronectin type III domain-containing protein, partial [Ruminococcus sp.]|nr:fibronectin type III domain-containing protein [Ruminococcus sp.]
YFDGAVTKYGSFSAVKSALTSPKATKITKKSAKTNSVKLTWKKVACTGYQVQKYDASKKKWTTVKTISKAKTVSYTVSGLKKNTTYKFRVRAYKKSGSLKSYSAWSKAVSAKTKK